MVFDTNVLISALITRTAPSAQLYEAWKARRLTLVTSETQLEEFAQVSRSPQVRRFFKPAEAGRLVNELRSLARVLKKLPSVTVSPDPADDFLFAMTKVGRADYLVTGDKAGVLALRKYGKTRIVTARQLIELLKR
ncbi:MAG: putative toxin-antitoxin system toxin component, PIN family [Deltaproteobacteria bacterium]|nr:putative toxin-antitoxin system toxin component, PIN family [Deltaproteobacteria bacterium]